VLSRPPGKADADWQEVDHGPGLIHLPAGQEYAVRAKNITDRDLAGLVKELAGLPALVLLNLSENRSITGAGLAHLRGLPGIRYLNLSSCGLSNPGLEHLKGLPRLERLDLSYCNRLTDLSVKSLRALQNLTFLDLQGCVKITNGGLSKLQRSGLTIHK